MKKRKPLVRGIFLLAVVMILSACEGADYVVLDAPWPAFNTDVMPLVVADGRPVFSFAFDADGNLLFMAENADELRMLNRDDGSVAVVTTGLPLNNWRGIVADGNSIFIGNGSGEIYEVNPVTGTTTLLTIIAGGEWINCLAIAPAGYGAYGGQLIAASNTGIYAVDQSLAVPTVVQIAAMSDISSIVFGSDGTLYATDYDNNRIVTVTAAGAVTVFATGLSGPDGITIDDAGGFLYVANCIDQTIKSVTIPGGVVSTVFTGLTFNGSWAPSPIIYDAAGNLLLVGYGPSDPLIIDYFDLGP